MCPFMNVHLCIHQNTKGLLTRLELLDLLMSAYLYSPKHYWLLYTLSIMDPFVNGHLYLPQYYGSLTALQLMDQFTKGSQLVCNSYLLG